MEKFTVHPIGKLQLKEGNTYVVVDKNYIPALNGLDNFSHINIFWWFDDNDSEDERETLETYSPYKGSPNTLGIFATRSPFRPNLIALTTVKIINIDYEKGIIQINYIDANNNTPILDIKPYTPSFDRVENPDVPSWCNTWPKSLEESANFDWESVFNF